MKFDIELPRDVFLEKKISMVRIEIKNNFYLIMPLFHSLNSFLRKNLIGFADGVAHGSRNVVIGIDLNISNIISLKKRLDEEDIEYELIIDGAYKKATSLR